MRVTSVPVTLAEEISPHAPGAMGIGKGRTYRESRKSGRSVTRLFCLFGIMQEFRLSSIDESKCRNNCAFSLVLKRLLVSNTELLCAFIVFVIM